MAATTQVTMPMLGLTMEEGTVAEWLKQEGERVEKDEPLLLVEMDKGTQEVPSPAAGTLRRILVQTGTTVPIRTPIAEIGDPLGADAAPAPSPSPASAAAPPAGERAAGGPGDVPPTEATPRELAAASASSAASSAAPPPTTSARPSGGPGDLPPIEATPRELATASASPADRSATIASGGTGPRQFVSPRARMRARALGVDLARVRGSGPHGRVVEADVLQIASAAAPAPAEERVLATPLARRLAQEHGVPMHELRGSGPGGRITQDDVLRAAQQRPAAAAAAGAEADGAGVQPLSRLRRLTAERMAASAQSTARVTLFLEADFTELGRFRQQLQPEFARLGVAKLPWDALLAKAAGLALVEHPAVAAQWVEGQGLRRAASVDVGVAVALEPEGLVVPVLRQAATRSLRELAADLLTLVDRARAGRLSPAEMQAGSFTITNLGAYRIDGFTPIVNPPETAILGVGRIADKPVVTGGRIEARTLCTLSLSFDHRVVDGAPAAAFLARLAELLERPYALLGI